jgi:hypothetical protein
MSDDPRFSYTFIWKALELACDKCAELDGMEWNADLFGRVLSDPFFGDVWDLEADQSLIHPNCRCAVICNAEFHPEEWTELQSFHLALTEFTGMSTGATDIEGTRSLIESLKSEVDDCGISMRQGEYTLLRLGFAFERLGLPKDVRQAIIALTRIIQTIRILQASMTMLEAAEGPVGWLFVLMNMASAGMTAMSAMNDIGAVM